MQSECPQNTRAGPGQRKPPAREDYRGVRTPTLLAYNAARNTRTPSGQPPQIGGIRNAGIAEQHRPVGGSDITSPVEMRRRRLKPWDRQSGQHSAARQPLEGLGKRPSIAAFGTAFRIKDLRQSGKRPDSPITTAGAELHDAGGQHDREAAERALVRQRKYGSSGRAGGRHRINWGTVSPAASVMLRGRFR